MEEKPRTLFTNGLYFGLITGGAMIVFHLLSFLLNLHTNRTVGWIGYVFLLGGMIYGTLEFRKKYSNGFISFGKAFSSCFLTGLFAGILFTIYFLIFAQYLHPAFITEMLDMTRENIAKSSQELSDEDIEKAMEISAKFMTPAIMAAFSFGFYLIFTLIAGLICSIFLKKEDPTLNSSM